MSTLAAILTPSQEQILRKSVHTFWRRVLWQTSVQYEDALQDCLVELLQRHDAPPSVWRFAYWHLFRQYCGNGQQQHVWFKHATYPLEQDETATDSLVRVRSVQHYKAAKELEMVRASGLADIERGYLYQNMWVVGAPGAYQHLCLYVEGNDGRHAKSKAARYDYTAVARGVALLRKAFPTREALLSPTKALVMSNSAKTNLVAYAIQTNQVHRLPGTPRSYRYRLKTIEKGAYVFDEDHAAFLERQLNDVTEATSSGAERQTRTTA